jgi:hypothetical protein
MGGGNEGGIQLQVQGVKKKTIELNVSSYNQPLFARRKQQ